MKIRTSFVSNSSSSSFIINRQLINNAQEEMIRNHCYYADKFLNEEHGLYFGSVDDAWYVDIKEKTIRVSTHMDNFDMYEFLKHIEVPEEAIKWEDY